MLAPLKMASHPCATGSADLISASLAAADPVVSPAGFVSHERNLLAKRSWKRLCTPYLFLGRTGVAFCERAPDKLTAWCLMEVVGSSDENATGCQARVMVNIPEFPEGRDCKSMFTA